MTAKKKEQFKTCGECQQHMKQEAFKEVIKYLEGEQKNNNIYRKDSDIQNEDTIEWLEKRVGVKTFARDSEKRCKE